MKRVIIVLMFVLTLFSVNASQNLISFEKMQEFKNTLDFSDYASLEAYNDYTVPKKNGEVNLLNYLDYSGGIRDQGNCGSCWVWSGILSTELALSIEAGVQDRLSVQYFDSNYREVKAEPCRGGDWARFKNFVNDLGKLIPWNNEDEYTDEDFFNDGYLKPSNEFSQDIYYPVNMDYKLIETNLVEDRIVENTFKEYLDHGKVIGFAYYLPEMDDWDKFRDFWLNENQDVVLNFDSLIDNQTGLAGGHAVNIVGYNEIERYWIVSNSWGDANGDREDGFFKISMDLDYDAIINYNGRDRNRYFFWIYDYEFGNEQGLRIEPEDDSNINIEKVVMDKKEVNAGDVITTSTKVSNDYEYMNLQNVKVTYFVPQLGLKRSVGPFDIEMFEDVMKRVYVDIPKGADAGVYDVRIVLQTEDTKEVRYEEIEVK